MTRVSSTFLFSLNQNLFSLNTLFVSVLCFIVWNYSFVFYAPDQNNILQSRLMQLPYSVGVFVDKSRTQLMIHILPQNVCFFVENGQLIYQPQYKINYNKHIEVCPLTHPEIAYVMSHKDGEKNPPQPVCRRPLQYLIKHIYLIPIYKQLYSYILNPMALVYSTLTDLHDKKNHSSGALNFLDKILSSTDQHVNKTNPQLQ